jgi:hypothetical protein
VRRSAVSSRSSTTERSGDAAPSRGAASSGDRHSDTRSAAAGESGTLPHAVASLHEAAGNKAVDELLENGDLQPKLRVSQPDTPAEREAEQVADAVVRTADPARDGPAETDPTDGSSEGRRRAARPVSLRASSARGGTAESATGETSRDLQSLKRGGRRLPREERSFFESRFDHDFGDVRIHTGRTADEVAGSIDAAAFTIGRHVAFARGNYRPGTSAGRRLLAHELTHVAQNRRGTTLARQVVRRSPPASASKSGSDLSSPRFRDDPVLEAVRDGDRLLTMGDESRAVTRIQHALVDAGHYLSSHGVDGKYGPETAAAVRAFQREKSSLSTDGVVGPNTLRALDERYGKMEAPSTLEGMYPTMLSWNRECMLDLFCEWNEQVIDDLRTRFTLKEFDEITVTMKRFNGLWWEDVEGDVGGYASYSRNEIGLKKDRTCAGGAGTLYQEWFHQHQPRDETTRQTEIRAHRFEEAFRMWAGLPPEESDFRRTDPATGRQEVDVDAIEADIEETYPGSTDRPGEEVIGKVDNGKWWVPDPTKVRINGREETRPPEVGDKYRTGLDETGLSEVDTSNWRCTGKF